LLSDVDALVFILCSQALYASTSISTGMKGATKAMVAMNKVLIVMQP
jgi:hypothetical protein